jgi:FkbM family methyltransferase
MSYFQFLHKINSKEIKVIFELGSRDLNDASLLLDHFEDSKIYSFECNDDCLVECYKNISNLEMNKRKRLFLINKAVSLNDGPVTFYPFDLQKYNNMGASSMLKIDFSMRNKDDIDYNIPNPQKEIIVDGIRLDTFVENNKLTNIDLLCIDLQGYELHAIQSLGSFLHKVKYIITECSIENTYIGGASFTELNNYLKKYNFKYVLSNKFGEWFPDLSLRGYSEFDALFINESAFTEDTINIM